MRMLHALLTVLGIRVTQQELFVLRGTNYKDANFQRMWRNFLVPGRLYTFAILVTMCVPSGAALLNLIRTPGAAQFTALVMNAAAPVQYVLSVRYFATNHFDKFHDTQRNLADSDNLIAAVTLICSVVATVCASWGAGESFRIFAIVRNAIGSCSTMLNACCFTFVFSKHVKIIEVYVQVFQSHDWRACDDHHVSMVLRHVVRMKESLTASTELLSYSFSSLTLFGGLIVGAVSYRWDVEMFNTTVYVALVLFVISQCMFFYMIFRLSEAKADIETLVRSADFADSFLGRSARASADAHTIETSSTLDWFVLTYLLQENWIDFTVVGLPLHSGAFLKQSVTIVGVLIAVAQQHGIM